MLLIAAALHAQEPEAGPGEAFPGGQDLEAPLPVAEGEPAGEPDAEPNDDAAELLAPDDSSPQETQPAARWQIHPHLDLKLTYDDNIFIQPRNEEEDLIFSFAPGIALGIWEKSRSFDSYLYRQRRASWLERPAGSFLFANYTATLQQFASHHSENSLGHDLTLEGQWQDETFTLGLLHRFVSGSRADSDLGGRVDRVETETTLSAAYLFTEKTALETAFSHTTADPGSFVRSEQWRSDTWLRYLATPITSVSLGAAFGCLEVEGAGQEPFQQALLRITYQVGGKIQARAIGGVEFREVFEGGQRSTPIFGLNVNYAPIEGTEIYIDAFRQTENSALEAGRDYIHTGAEAGLRHRIGGNVHLLLEGGWRLSEYQEPVGGRGRTDRYRYVRSGVLYNPFRWGNLQLIWQHARNGSTIGDFSYSSNQLELQLSVLF